MDILKSIRDIVSKFRGEKQKEKLQPISTAKDFIKADIKRAILRHNLEDIGK